MSSSVALNFEKILTDAWAGQNDPAHDLGHIRRVVANATKIASSEGGNLDVIIPAAWLHDIINLPKNHPDRAQGSTLSANEALKHLKAAGFNGDIHGIHHAIAAHSFSAGIEPETLEAKILQDADRLDALGAIGIARMFAVGGKLSRPLFDSNDPLAENRAPDDTQFSLDHIQVKLIKIAETLHTKTARDIAASRVEFMLKFAWQISVEAKA
ncbi:MAG TPA: HD domain-containing protein [Alphaproteobacteria bacterium]